FLLLMFASDSALSTIFSRALTVTADASFLGRSDTSLVSLYKLSEQIPSSLFFGLKGDFVSDSAFVSIMAGSGVFAFLSFIFYALYSLFQCHGIKFSSKIILLIVFLLGASMIGDFFIPIVSTLWFLLFFTY